MSSCRQQSRGGGMLSEDAQGVGEGGSGCDEFICFAADEEPID